MARDARDELDRYRDELEIDEAALSDCLVSQPQLYYHVTMGYARAAADVDASKLDLDELRAETDRRIREEAAAEEEKITEALVQQRVKLDDGIRDAERSHASARTRAALWQAMRDAFQQRSFMLRELVALRVAERYDGAAASGAGQRPRDPATRMADDVVRAGAEARRGYRVRSGARS